MQRLLKSRSASTSGAAVTPKDQYLIARAYVEHENTLVGQRTTWYLTFQGLLFTAIFVAIGLFDPQKFPVGGIVRKHLVVAVFFLGVLGVGSSIVAYMLIKAAYAQIDRVSMWWSELNHPKAMFPPITGGGGFKIFGLRLNASHFLVLLCFVWIGLMAIFANVAMQVA